MANELAGRLEQGWQEGSGRVSVIDGAERWTGGQLLEQAERIATALRARGVVPGEPIAVLVSNRATDFAAFLAVWRCGGAVVPVSRSAPKLAVDRVLAAAGSRLVVDGSVGAPDGTPGLEVRGAAPPQRDPILSDAAVVVFTSGTTAGPKGVVLSHAALAAKLSTNGCLLSFDAQGCTQLALQTTFSFGLWLSLLTLTTGGTLVARRSFDVRGALADLVEHRVTRTAWVPTMLRAIVATRAEPEVAPLLEAVRDAGTLRHIYTGGEILTGTLARAVTEAFPRVTLFNIFGLTETATSDFLLSGEELLRHAGAVGRAAPGVSFRIVDGEGRPLPRGEVGELQIETRTIMSGYLGQPELTRASFADGFFRTGDLARETPNGIVEVVGRSKEVISRGGNKIYPQEVEQALQSHPAVGVALATGVPDPLMGERIHVAVLLRQGAEADTAALRAWAAERLERFKIPDVIHLVAELPTGATGKADRGRLRRVLCEEGAAGVATRATAW